MHKILVVDDQPDNVYILQDRLENEGYEVITAYEGETGIKKAKEEEPDLILLDVMMPKISGFDVCKILSGDETTRDIPIILLTALIDPEDLKKGFQSGAFDYVKKPFNKVELFARIKSALKFRESKKLLLEMEKINTFAATIVTANHEIKQPLTLINLSTTALRREVSKENISREAIEKRITYIENAAKEIMEVLEKLTSIKKPKFIDYINNLKMIDIKE
ncbi:MAG: response regulator [Ignavibacteria bacterium]|jgi:two-component system cell cycle response regulator